MTKFAILVRCVFLLILFCGSLEAASLELNKIEKLEERLFKGKGHLKRGQGITQLPKDVENEFINFIVEKVFDS